MKVVHITTAHPWRDTRIFIRECSSLSSAGYQTHLVAPNAPNEVKNGVHIHSIQVNNNARLFRITKSAWKTYQIARGLNADIYHFHDLGFIPFGLLLKWQNKKVIYDVHEDFPRQISIRKYIPGCLRRLIVWLIEKIENFAAKQFDAIVAATPFIRDRFLKIDCNVLDVNNFPILSEFYMPHVDWSKKERTVCYVGASSDVRGIFKMIEAIEQTDAKLLLVGEFYEKSRNKAVSMPGWDKIEELGQLDRNMVKKILLKSMTGLIMFHPVPNNINSQPNKMFEYMSAGIPVIASNFPLWKDIIEGNKCGICVDPMNPKEIAKAVQWIVDHQEDAKRMGENARNAVEEKYNWENENKKLLRIYEEVLRN